MTELTYFTPSIEDIRVGYECELFWNQDILPENNWYKITVGELGTEDIEYQFYVDKVEIRTPYLTKEQIEGENFRFDTDNYGSWEFSKWEIDIWYNPRNYILQITQGGQKPPQDIFYGKCKDINTFRYITKLLGI